MAVQGTNGGGPGAQEAVNPATESCSVFVNGLSLEVSSETLKEVFGRVGRVASAVVMRDHFGASRGFGFVNFTKADEADRAIQQFNKIPHCAGTWLVRKAEKRKPEQKAGQVSEQGLDLCNLFIRGVEPEISSIRLQSMFEAFGKVVSSKILVDPKTGASKCAGFLRFTLPEEAARAIHEMNGKQVGSKRLFVTLAQKRATTDPQGIIHPPFEQSAAQPSTPTGMAYFMPMSGMAPQYPQGAHGHPAFQPYGMYPPGMVPIHPQAYQQGYGPPPQLVWQGMPMAAFQGMPPGYQQADPRAISRQQQQAQQYYMMTSGQDGTYFDMASNSFMHSGRGYRSHMGRGAATPRGGGRRGRQLFPEPPASNHLGQPRAPVKVPLTVNSKPVARRDVAPGAAPKDAPTNTKDLVARLAATPDKLVRVSMMGDLLFTLVQGLQPAKDSAKITGMLLEMTEPEILHILEDRAALIKKVDEALGVLKAAGYKEAKQQVPKELPSTPKSASEEPKAAPASDAAQSSAPSEGLEKLRLA